MTREPDGTELGWHGTYLEIDRSGRLVSTEVFEGYPDGEAQRHDDPHRSATGRRSSSVTVLHTSKENRDGHIALGHGAAACSTPSTASRTCSLDAAGAGAPGAAGGAA